MKLQHLKINRTRITSLDPLTGMPLIRLEMIETDVADLSPLRNMPIEFLEAAECTKISSLTPLKECKNLKTISVPYHLDDYSFIKVLPKLKFVDIELISGKDQTVKRFKELMDIE